jgi:hypothetical protein
MTMTGRFVDHGVRILAAVALLMAVISSPIRPTGLSYPGPSSKRLPRSFTIFEFGHSRPFEMSSRPSGLREADSLQSDIEDELDADIEDELTVTSPLASGSFDVLPYPCPEPYFEVVSFAVPLAAQPLRC